MFSELWNGIARLKLRTDVWILDFLEQISVVFGSKKCFFFVFKLFGQLICCLESILGAFWYVLILKML